MSEKNLPADPKSMEVTYKSGDVDVRLNPTIIRKYLVRGKPEFVTDQEIAFFMGLCRAREMNPFAGDCYPLKYSQTDPMAMVVSIDFKRSRARKHDDCRGWQKGIIVKKADGELRYSNGIILDGETLLGGWFEATPEGWKVPFKLEVNLSGYIKKTFDGKITKFWQPENQPTMIAKVAESQGLSAVWSRDLGKLYTQEEIGVSDMGDGPLIEMGNGGGRQESETKPIPARVPPNGFDFKRLVNESLGDDPGILREMDLFVTACAIQQKQTEEWVKNAASKDFPKFLKLFRSSLKKKKELKGELLAEMEAKAAKKGTTPEPEKTSLRGAQLAVDPATGEVTPFPDEMESPVILCPDMVEVPSTYCPPCPRGAKIGRAHV